MICIEILCTFQLLRGMDSVVVLSNLFQAIGALKPRDVCFAVFVVLSGNLACTNRDGTRISEVHKIGAEQYFLNGKR